MADTFDPVSALHDIAVLLGRNGYLKSEKTCLRIIEILKNHEKNTFTVIDRTTGHYPDIYNIALHEDWAKGLCYCDMEGFAIEEDGSLWLMDECGNERLCPSDRFEVKWDE